MPSPIDYFRNIGPDQNQNQGPPPGSFQPPMPPRTPIRDTMGAWANTRTLAWILVIPFVLVLAFIVPLVIDWAAGLGSETTFNVLR